MHIIRTVKSAAVAAAVLLATAGASFAAQYAWVDQDAKVRQFHQSGSPVVNWVSDGQKVKIVGSWKNWYRLQIPGPDGWVKKNVIDSDPWSYDDWPHGGGNAQVCLGGWNGYFCIGN